MGRMDDVISEMKNEARKTRTLLERIPDGVFDFQPHPKSMALGALASHLVDTYRWAEGMIPDTFTFDMAQYKPFEARTTAELLAGLDENVALAEKALASIDDEAAQAHWKMVDPQGNVMLESQRLAMCRDILVYHTIHHRAQLGVYLRLNDVPLPAMFGPTADEGMPA